MLKTADSDVVGSNVAPVVSSCTDLIVLTLQNPSLFLLEIIKARDHIV